MLSILTLTQFYNHYLQVRVHTSSLNCNWRQTSPAALAFDERMRLESSLFVMQTSVLPPHVLLLVAARLEEAPLESLDSDSEDYEDEDDDNDRLAFLLQKTHSRPSARSIDVYNRARPLPCVLLQMIT